MEKFQTAFAYRDYFFILRQGFIFGIIKIFFARFERCFFFIHSGFKQMNGVQTDSGINIFIFLRQFHCTLGCVYLRPDNVKQNVFIYTSLQDLVKIFFVSVKL